MATNKNNQTSAATAADTNVAPEATQPEVNQPEVNQPEAPPVPKAPEKKEIYIERGSANEDPNYAVCVNGVMYLLPKGKTSTVPMAVYNEIMRSRRAREQQDQRMDELRGAAKQP